MAHRYVLAYFICAFGLVAGQSTRYALKGLEVTMTPSIPGQPDNILWKHNGNKAVEFNAKEEKVFGPFKNRVTLDWVTAELNITHLTYEDSGVYELETYRNKAMHRSQYKLEVIDKVAKPNISCEMIDGSSSNTSGIQATLMCSDESSRPQSLMEFEWSSRGNVQPGPKLIISLGDEHDDEVYSCNVKNPLTNEGATFTAKDCYPDKISSVGLIVGLVILFALIPVLLFLGYKFRKKLVKACWEKGKRVDLEKQSPPGTTEGSDEKTSQDEESRPLIDRAPTLPSKQQLRSLNQMEPNDSASKDKEAIHSDPDTVKESGKEADEDEEAKSAPASDVPSPSPQLHSSLTQSLPHMAPEDNTVKLKEDANSDQVTGETTEENHRESISSDDSSKEKQSSTIPEQKGSETTAHEQDSHLEQGETDTKEDNQQETDKPVSEDEKESDSVGDQEEIDKAQNQSIATSQQPQSATLTTPDNSNTNTFQESPDTAQADPEQEGKTIHDLDESEGQPDSSTAEEDKGEGQSVEEKKEVQCDPKEEKPGNMSLKEDKEE